VVATSGRKLRILLAEDNRVNQDLAVGFLELAGHTARIADTGWKAVEYSAEERFDLILMDVQMPGMDGFQATAAIRAREQRSGRHTPIIAMTAHAMAGDRERCLEAGMDAYVAKPIRAAALFEAIGRSLQARPQGMRPGAGGPPIPEAPAEAVTSNTHQPVFEEEEALRQCLGRRELLHKVLMAFVDNVPRLTGALAAELAKADLTGLGRVAHTIKGAAGNISAKRVFSSAMALEQVARSGEERLARETAEILERELLVLERTLTMVLETAEVPAHRDITS
jgi:CheY-like chemotaxis protein/HPt (histidine-containing phosphotransfer) domain-containing protein